MLHKLWPTDVNSRKHGKSNQRDGEAEDGDGAADVTNGW